MASIHKRAASPYYWGKFTGPDGRQVFRSTKQTKPVEARNVVEAWSKASKMARNRELTQSTTLTLYSRFMEETLGVRPDFLTIGGAIEEWVNNKIAMGRSEGTTNKYVGIAVNFLDFLDERTKAGIGSLTASEIGKWRDAEYADGKSETTCDQEIRIIRSALEYARRKGYCLSNVADAVDMFDGNQEDREPFTNEEIKRLFNAANTDWRGAMSLLLTLNLCPAALALFRYSRAFTVRRRDRIAGCPMSFRILWKRRTSPCPWGLRRLGRAARCAPRAFIRSATRQSPEWRMPEHRQTFAKTSRAIRAIQFTGNTRTYR